MLKWFRKNNDSPASQEDPSLREKFGDGIDSFTLIPKENLSTINSKVFQVIPTVKPMPGVGMDSASSDGCCDNSAQFGITSTFMNDALLSWYASQSFIGFQACAMIAQNWLIEKVCRMPAEDAIRNSYAITVNDGVEVPKEALKALEQFDAEMKINSQMLEFLTQGRVFGIRVAMFHVDSEDVDYYKKPFNPDGVKKGSYRGISQIDPMWIAPQLDRDAASNPASMHFYEPTWWQINGQLVHRTHLVIFKTGTVPDVLKPTYQYAGVSVPQKIYERVYAAERTANEAPMLALSKRTTVMTTDLAAMATNPKKFMARVSEMARLWTNYGIKLCGLKDKIEQHDTSLADFDALIMTQYQLVAAAGDVPAVKLLGTTPKGFNATGEYEERSYHEYLKSTQTHHLSPLLERHHLLAIRSEIAPAFGMQPFDAKVVWNPLEGLTAKESAEVKKLEAETGQLLITVGAVDSQEERSRVIADPDSGYNGLPEELPESEEPDETPEEQSDPIYG